MLNKLQLENYRCFDKHEITFKEIAVIVGKNNAGKSTIIEALRLVSVVASRALNYQSPPKWVDLNKTYKGVSPSLTGLGFSVKNIFHKYQEAPAKITASFTNKARIEIFIGEEAEVFAIMFDTKGNIILSKQTARKAEIPEINILPQISALAREEKVLGLDYVKANLSTHLTSLHFRNQVKYFREDFTSFRELAESSWPGLGISELDGRSLFKGAELHLIVRDYDFAAEVGWMGHGLQMWLQTMWFLSRSNTESTVILDEPDVYMHADLQRKLIRLLKHRFKQVFIATHSIEIISEVEPDNILVIDKTAKKSNYTTSFPAVQNIVNSIGSIQNIGLARLWSAKKLLLVEGKDVGILKRIQDTIFGDLCDSFDIIPRSDIGGWSGWNLVKGTDFILKNGLKQKINVFCILDSDYYLEDEINERKEEARKGNINLHIWSKKEIENYLLSPPAMLRVIHRKGCKDKCLTVELIEESMDQIVEGLKSDIIGNYADQIQRANKRNQASTAHRKATELVDNRWSNKLAVAPGKQVLKSINGWLGEKFGVSVTAHQLAQEIRLSEIDPELIEIVKRIEKNEVFD